MVNYVVSKDFISLVIDDVPYNVNKNNSNFEEIKQRLKDEDYTNLLDLINESTSIEKKFKDENISVLTIKGSSIFYKEKVVDNSIVSQIIETKKQGYKFDNLIKFLENILENTSYSIVEELYDWISSSKTISITEDGAFLAYKKVKENYFDIYSGTMDNSIGNIVEMKRNEVDDKRENTCSKGLHFCSYNYLSCYGNNNDTNKVLIVKIFPQDVVSIPVDYNFQKGRCFKYEVVGEVNDWKDGEFLDKPVDDYFANDKSDSFAPEEAYCEDETDEGIDVFAFKDIIKNLTTPMMTNIYNTFHDKNIHHIRTRREGISYMRMIYNRDYDYFIRLVNREL